MIINNSAMPTGGTIRIRHIGRDLWERNEACSPQEPREPRGYMRLKTYQQGCEGTNEGGTLEDTYFLLRCNNACRIKERELHLLKMPDIVNHASCMCNYPLIFRMKGD